MIESLKAALIRATDFVNKVHDPFDDFTRPKITEGESKYLHELEASFYDDLVGRFWGCDGQILLHRIPLPQGSPIDTGDQAIWHGIYTGVLALRYHLAPNPGVANRVYADLVQCSKGLQLHQTFHGEQNPRLIRGVSDDLKTFEDEASNDSATGHLFGIYFGWKFGPKSLRPVFSQLALGLASEILAHDHAIVRQDGKPTRYGALIDGWKTDPLRLTLALAIYAVAATLTDQPAFMKAYSDLYVKYKPILAYPKVKFLWMENYNDTHRAAIHLAILADLTQGPARQTYIYGLERMRRMIDKEANIWINAICDWGGYGWAPDNRDDALRVLGEFSLERKSSNEGRDAYARWFKVVNPPWKWFKPLVWNGKWMANQPIPRWAARSQDFFWQRNLRSLDVGTNGHGADSILNGGDFLAAYWMSRLAGILGPED